MNTTINRRIFDAIVWSASLLFAFGLLLDTALADAKGFPPATRPGTPNASISTSTLSAFRVEPRLP